MNHDGTLLLLPLQSLLSCYTLLVVLASVICFKFEDTTDKCKDSDLMTVKNKSYKGATIKSTCHIRRTKSIGIVDLPRSVPAGKEWQNGRFSPSLRMAPFLVDLQIQTLHDCGHDPRQMQRRVFHPSAEYESKYIHEQVQTSGDASRSDDFPAMLVWI